MLFQDYVLGPGGVGVIAPDPIRHTAMLELLAEFALLISLFAVGLKLGVPIRDRRWWLPLRLAFPSMLMTVGLIAVAEDVRPTLKGNRIMQLGMMGLGRMGSAMAQRMQRGGHQVIGFDPLAEARQRYRDAGGEVADSPAQLLSRLDAPRVIWLMVPAGDITDTILNQLLPLLDANDIVVDGGNANYKDTLRRGQQLAEKHIPLVDCGTSGGVWGLQDGYSLMIGGDVDAVERLRPVFEVLAPERNRGWARVGPPGAGHFAKMVHNGIEYGMMQSIAEGFAILQKKEAFDFDLQQVAEVWRYGSVVRSWLLDLTASVLQENPSMKGIAPYVDDSGEGRWTVLEAMDLDVFAPVITLSLLGRIRSRDPDMFGDKLLAALRNAFGGHAINESHQ